MNGGHGLLSTLLGRLIWESRNDNLNRCSKIIKRLIQSQRYYLRWRRLLQYSLGSLFQRNPYEAFYCLSNVIRTYLQITSSLTLELSSWLVNLNSSLMYTVFVLKVVEVLSNGMVSTRKINRRHLLKSSGGFSFWKVLHVTLL